MSHPVERSAVLKALDAIRDPKSGRGLVAAGLVQGLVVAEGRAGFMLEVEPGDAQLYAAVREEAEAVLKNLSGVERAQVVLTADRAPGQAARAQEPPVPPGTVRMRRNTRIPDDAQAQAMPPEARPAAGLKPAHVGHVIAVASGKGGVGKSTVAVNLAAACSGGAVWARTSADMPALRRMRTVPGGIGGSPARSARPGALAAVSTTWTRSTPASAFNAASAASRTGA